MTEGSPPPEYTWLPCRLELLLSAPEYNRHTFSD